MVGEDALDRWSLDYTGGAGGLAVGAPVKIGYVNQETAFPENTVGLDAAVMYINSELGGIRGRPLEIVRCDIAVPEDGAACGARMAGDVDVVAVVTGTILVGNAEFYAALEGVKPVLIGNAVTPDDFDTEAGTSFNAGAVGVISGLGTFIATYLPATTTVAVVASGETSAPTVAEQLLRPVLAAADITATFVTIDPSAGPSQVRDALAAVDAVNADVLVPLASIQQCVDVADAIGELSRSPTVVTTGRCLGRPMTDHLAEVGQLGEAPNGWYVVDMGFNYFDPDLESGMQTYQEKIQQYGVPVPGASSLDVTGDAGTSFANVMTLAKLLNGLDEIDTAGVDDALRGFSGPMMLQVGSLECGGLSVPGPLEVGAMCAHQVGVQQFIDGAWTSIADGLNGRPIDVDQF